MTTDNEGGFLPDKIDLTGLAPQVVRFVESAREAFDEDDDPDAVSLAIATRQLTGTTAEAILAAGETTKLKDLIGHNVTVNGYRWRKSDIGEGEGVYMLLDVTRDDGTTVETVSAGAMSVMAQVFALAENGLLPIAVYVKQADKPTKRGYRPIQLLPAEAAF